MRLPQWLLPIAIGTGILGAGIGCFLNPAIGSVAANYLIGLAVLGIGISEAVAVRRRARRLYHGILALVFFISASAFFSIPHVTLPLTTLIFGVGIAVLGFHQLADLLRGKPSPDRAVQLLGAIVSLILAALIFLFLPVAARVTLGVILGVDLVLIGMLGIEAALRDRFWVDSCEQARLSR